MRVYRVSIFTLLQRWGHFIQRCASRRRSAMFPGLIHHVRRAWHTLLRNLRGIPLSFQISSSTNLILHGQRTAGILQSKVWCYWWKISIFGCRLDDCSFLFCFWKLKKTYWWRFISQQAIMEAPLLMDWLLNGEEIKVNTRQTTEA